MVNGLVEIPDDTRWRSIPDFADYMASDNGLVFSMKNMVLLEQHKHHYTKSVYVWLFDGKRKTRRSVNKIVDTVFGAERKDSIFTWQCQICGDIFTTSVMIETKEYALLHTKHMHPNAGENNEG